MVAKEKEIKERSRHFHYQLFVKYKYSMLFCIMQT